MNKNILLAAGALLLHIGSTYSMKKDAQAPGDIPWELVKSDYRLVEAAKRKADFHEFQHLYMDGASVNCRNAAGETPLNQAVKYGLGMPILVLIDQAGAFLDLADNEGNYPLHYAVNVDLNEVPQMTRDRNLYLLIEAGANTQAIDAKGRTAFAIAQERGDKNAMMTILTSFSRHDLLALKVTFNKLFNPADVVGNESPFPREVGKVIIDKLIPEVIKAKVAKVKEYFPEENEVALRLRFEDSIMRIVQKYFKAQE